MLGFNHLQYAVMMDLVNSQAGPKIYSSIKSGDILFGIVGNDSSFLLAAQEKTNTVCEAKDKSDPQSNIIFLFGTCNGEDNLSYLSTEDEIMGSILPPQYKKGSLFTSSDISCR